MDVIAYTASPRKTPESKKDDGYIVPGTGDPNGEFPSAWYSGTAKEDVHEFLKQEIDLLVVAVPLTYVLPPLTRFKEEAIISNILTNPTTAKRQPTSSPPPNSKPSINPTHAEPTSPIFHAAKSSTSPRSSRPCTTASSAARPSMLLTLSHCLLMTRCGRRRMC